MTLNPDPNTWTTYNFTATAGPDVSGGVTLQLGATTAGISGSTATMWYDNVSVMGEVIPEPATLGLLGLAGAGLFIRRKLMI